MEHWQEDQLNSLLTNTCEARLFETLQSLGHSLGFDYCAYGLRIPTPITHPKVILLNNYSAEWNQHYQQKGYMAIDPTVKHALSSSLPIVWSDTVFGTAKELWSDAQAAGLKVGWAQACHNPNGATGLLTFARTGEALSPVELRDKQPKLAWLAQVAHEALSRKLLPELVPESKAVLSTREAEVLRWSAAGKTSEETADILGISERTVSFHVNNSRAKLNCTNKISVVVKAVSLGLLG